MQIAGLIADGPGAIEVETEIGSCGEDHAGAGLAPGVLGTEGLDRARGVIGTEVEGVEGNAVACKEFAEAVVDSFDGGKGVYTSGNAALG